MPPLGHYVDIAGGVAAYLGKKDRIMRASENQRVYLRIHGHKSVNVFPDEIVGTIAASLPCSQSTAPTSEPPSRLRARRCRRASRFPSRKIRSPPRPAWRKTPTRRVYERVPRRSTVGRITPSTRLSGSNQARPPAGSSAGLWQKPCCRPVSPSGIRARTAPQRPDA